MAVFAITNVHTADDEVDVPVFECGPGVDLAIALFTDEEKAQSFIADAGWEGDQAIAEMSTKQAASLMLEAYEDNINFLAIDPDHASGDAAAIVRITNHPVEAATELNRLLDDRSEKSSTRRSPRETGSRETQSSPRRSNVDGADIKQVEAKAPMT